MSSRLLHESSRAWRSRRLSPPRQLIDPEGEGVYLLDDLWEDFYHFSGVLRRAAAMLFDDAREWRNVDVTTVWMYPDRGRDEWVPVSTGRFPRGWRLNLPRRWRPAAYAYCTPKAETLQQEVAA